jgi:hypothetical protein
MPPPSASLPRTLSSATRLQSFVTNNPLGGMAGPNSVYQETGESMNELQHEREELDGRLNVLQRGLSDVLQVDDFQTLLEATPLFTNPDED